MNMSNSSPTRIQCDFSWTIQNLVDFDGDPSNHCVANSPKFSSANDIVEWFVELRAENNYCPHRHRNNRKSRNISFYLGYDKLEKRCRIIGEFEFSFVNSIGQRMFKGPIYFCLHYSDEAYVCIKEFPECVYVLRKFDFVHNDQLTIYCGVSYVHEAEVNPILIDQPVYFKENFETFLNNEVLSDVAIYVGGKKFPCHKIILATRSSVFKAMFSHNMVENVSGRIDIRDFDENIIQQALRYIYTGKVDISEATAALDLLRVADKYDLTNLKTLCEKELSTMLTVENAVKILFASDTYKLENLKPRAMKFVETNLKEIIDTDAWDDLVSQPDVIKILLKKFVE